MVFNWKQREFDSIRVYFGQSKGFWPIEIIIKVFCAILSMWLCLLTSVGRCCHNPPSCLVRPTCSVVQSSQLARLFCKAWARQFKIAYDRLTSLRIYLPSELVELEILITLMDFSTYTCIVLKASKEFLSFKFYPIRQLDDIVEGGEFFVQSFNFTVTLSYFLQTRLKVSFSTDLVQYHWCNNPGLWPIVRSRKAATFLSYKFARPCKPKMN